jgi:hypothetical protein
LPEPQPLFRFDVPRCQLLPRRRLLRIGWTHSRFRRLTDREVDKVRFRLIQHAFQPSARLSSAALLFTLDGR